MNKSVALVSKSSQVRDVMRSVLERSGHAVVCFENETICLDNLEALRPEIVITFTDSCEMVWRFVSAIHLTSVGSALLVCSDMLKEQFFHNVPGDICFIKPPQIHNGLPGVVQALGRRSRIQPKRYKMPVLVGQSRSIRKIRSQLTCIANACDPVFIKGEPGTGKELLAQHFVAGNLDNPCFIKIDCEKLQPGLLSRHDAMKRLLYTGARCEGGGETSTSAAVFFLFDKINLLKTGIQKELLLLLEDRDKLTPPGEANKCRRPNIRIIATCDSDLEAQVSSGFFRKDLYYRLNVIPLTLPPLRKRKEDIPLLVDYYLIEASLKYRKSISPVSMELLRHRLLSYPFPGNIGELKKIVRRLVITGDESFLSDIADIPRQKKYKSEYLSKTVDGGILPNSYEIQSYLPGISKLSLKQISDTFVMRTEKKLMMKALESTNWNRKEASKILNISYKSLLNKIKEYGLA